MSNKTSSVEKKYRPHKIKGAVYKDGDIVGYYCKACGEYKVLNGYYWYKGKRVSAYCRKCRTKKYGYKKKLYIELVYDTEGNITAKQCKSCGKVLPLEKFYSISRGRGGRSSKCKECTAERYIADKVKALKGQL